MKRRVVSLVITLAVCLNLCPVWVLAADEDGGLCPHHSAHTAECGYVPPVLEQECTHNHDDGCYTTETNCVHEHTAECYPASDGAAETGEPALCTHTCTEDSGCITRTLSCPHEHDETCGYVPGNPGAPCTFVCQICPIEGLIAQLPDSVSEDNLEQIQTQLSEIYARYDELTGDEQQQVDLSPCVSLLDQIDGMDSAIYSDTPSDSPDKTHTLDADKDYDSPYVVSERLTLNTDKYTLTGLQSTAIQVTAEGELYLAGKVVAKKGDGVEVMAGGSLNITQPGTDIQGAMYGLNIASGANVYLSAGRYFGRSAAIQADDFASLLAPGCGYFTESGNPVLPEDVAALNTVVVGQCTDHGNKVYTHAAGATKHTWECPFCAASGTEPCTFSFDQSGEGICGLCGNEVTVEVDRDSLKDLAYDSTVKPANGTVTVRVKDAAAELTADTDYTVSYSTQADVGSTSYTVTVTVTGKTYNGVFTQDYTFLKEELEKPVLQWDTPNISVPVTVDYDGSQVETTDLPSVKINITSSEDLHRLLQYSFKKAGDTAYINDLPTDAGTYHVVVSLPAGPDYQAASSEPITLVIEKISPIATAPAAAKLTYNRAAQALVTPGALVPAAVRDNLEIKFATSADGPFFSTIPTGVDAGAYHVWYTVEVTDNYLPITPDPTEITGVKILRKPITPVVELSQLKYQYDGEWKQPGVTVKDNDDKTVLPNDEYQVTYLNNRDVGQATVEVSDKPGGNYEIKTVAVHFQITSRAQETLTITNRPNTVIYGGQYTLETSGGSGNGIVTWEITTGKDVVATVDPNSGQVTIVGHGSATVKATKSGQDPATGVINYDDATAIWTLTAAKKPVTAIVTAEDKFFDGNRTAAVHAVVEQGVLPGDVITITDLIGTFDDENAGVDKTVTVSGTPTITGNNSQHYDISYSSLTVKATIKKAIVEITTPPVPADLTYNGTAQTLIAIGAGVNTTGVDVEYALREDGPYTTTFPEGIYAGTYTVWYRIQETDNYTGLPQDSVDVTIAKKTVTPQITLDKETFVYDGAPKEPAVTLYEADGTTLIPDNEYTAVYSNNVDVGTNAAVTVTAKDDGNYSFAPVTKNFTISEKQAKVLTAPEPAGRPLFFTNYNQQLVTAGTAEGGTMVYSVGDENGYSSDIPERTVAGTYKVYYKVQGDGNHSDSLSDSVEVTIAPKGVTPTIELQNDDGTPFVSCTYDGNAKEPKVVVKDGSTVIAEGEYTIVYSNNKDAGPATVSITDNPNGNYTVTGSATFEILKADIVDPAPSAANLTYNGEAQALLIPGTTSGGTIYYALRTSTSEYHDYIPTGVNAGDYKVYYKVTGDKNHNDFPITEVPVTIHRKPLTNITIELTPAAFAYDGAEKMPAITVKDGKTILPEEEYTWTCTPSKPINEGTYTIEIADAAGGNYDLTGVTDNTADFTIGKIPQDELVIEGKPPVTNYGDSFQLTMSGGSANGAVTWNASGPAAVDAAGNVTITGVGEVTIMAEKAADTNYYPAQAQLIFTAAPKPVMADVVVSSKVYDGTNSVDNTAITVTVANGDLVNAADNVTISGLAGTYDDVHVGTNKTVTLDVSHVQVTGADAAKYAISYPDTATAAITQATTQITADPKKIAPLTYNRQPQALVTAGQTDVGFLVYSLNGTDFSPEIPTGTNAGAYDVYYKVVGTADYTEVPVNTTPVSVTIDPKTINPQVELSESSFPYDGTRKDPKVTVKDGDIVIEEKKDYTVTWANDDPSVTDGLLTAAGTYTATIAQIADKNYTFADVTVQIEIVKATQDALKITGKPAQVYYGNIITLDTIGGSGNGTVTWSITKGDSIAAIDADTGVLTINHVGDVTVKAEREVPNYGTVSDTWSFTAKPKPVTAVVTADDKVYDGDKRATIHVAWEEGALLGTDSIDTSRLSGEFDDENAGMNKTVHITGGPIISDKYAVTIPATTTASILKADATAPTLTAKDREYDSTTQALVDDGDANTIYSDAQGGVYSTTVPTGTNAGTYTVWYKEKGDANHNDSQPQSIQVTITRKPLTADATNTTLSGNDLQREADGTYYYAYDGTERKPAVTITTTINGSAVTIPASEYTVSYSDNKNVSSPDKKAAVTITDSGSGNYNVNGSVNFEIRQSSAQLVTYPQARILTYTGQMQELVTGGTVTGGHIEYALDGGSYGRDIPKADEAGTYTVAYKVVGDGNHSDGATGSVSVTIKPKEVISPKVTVSGSYTYTGNPQIPADGAVTVEDGGIPIPRTEYTLSYRENVNAGTATVVIVNANGGNYIVNGTGTFEITKDTASVAEPPKGLENLPYIGAEQELVQAGSTADGTMMYSLSETGKYIPTIPSGKAVDTYIVWYKVQGDGNHTDSVPQSVTASIIPNEVTNPTIQVTPASATFNGEKQEPTVTVKDNQGRLIDGSEYTVTYLDENNNSDLIQVGTYVLSITSKGSNYDFTNAVFDTKFKITPAGQTPLTITGTREKVYYGDTIQLGTAGGSGTVTWDVGGSSIASITNGQLKITGVGSVTVTATSQAAGYTNQEATWSFYADKKQVTAVVTAAAKPYDGSTAAVLTATLQDSGLINGDDVTIDLTGSFEDADVGTDKKVSIDRTQTSITGADKDKYDISYPAFVTASIFKAEVDETKVIAPTPATGLEYTGLPLTLVTAGSSPDGIMEYSQDGGITYSASLPTGTDAGDYEIWYRVKGDGNHKDTAGKQMAGKVTIARQTVDAPRIEFTPGGASYDGQEHKPSVTVKDANGRVIPATEYTVDYGTTDWIKAGDHVVTITGKADGNYSITGTHTATFTILPAGQSPLTIVGQPGKFQYGDSFTLSAVGGSGTGAVIWEASGADGVISINSQTGRVEILKAGGPVIITARKLAGGGYSESTATWTFSAEKKPVTAVVTAEDKVYDGTTKADLRVNWRAGDLLNGDTIDLVRFLNGQFDHAGVGDKKTVRITDNGSLPGGDKYTISYNTETTASILPAASSVTAPTEIAGGLTYTGQPQNLVNAGAATNGTIMYSLDGIVYGPNVPQGTNAGSYTVWYKVIGNENYKDVAPEVLPVTIKAKTVSNPVIGLSPTEFEYDGTPKKPDVVVKDNSTVIPVGEYAVNYSNNTAVGTAVVTISDNADGNYIVSGTASFQIKAGTASLIDEPQPNNRTYDGFEQALVTPGGAVNGTVVYSETENGAYTTSIPRKTNAGTYQVWYKVEGANGASDTTPRAVTVTIRPMQVTPIVLLNNQYAYSTPYTGSPITPSATVIVEGRVLGSTEYLPIYSNNTNVGTATVTVQNLGGNYQFFVVATFEITKGKAQFLVEPQGISDLVYTGEPRELVSRGYTVDGIVLYSLDAYTYSALIPTETKVGKYMVFAKVQGDSKHEDSEIKVISAEIKTNTLSADDLSVTLFPSSFNYTGSENRPAVTVTDKTTDNVIPDTEYTVTYSNNIDIGNATVTITSKGNNYSFTTSATFAIVGADQPVLTITGRKDTVYYGDTLDLDVIGGSGDGEVKWEATGPVTGSDGQYKITSSGSVTITATKEASGSYKEVSDTWSFHASPKPASAVVIAADKTYDGTDAVSNWTVVINSSDLVPNDIVSGITAAGYFIDGNAQENKTVIITGLTIPTGISEKYKITWPATTTASIDKATPTISTKPTASSIVSGQTLSQSTLTLGEASANGASVPGRFVWTDGSITPDVGTAQQEVTFTPADLTNYNSVTCEVDVTVQAASGGGSDSISFSLPNRQPTDGTASAVLSTADGSKLVQEAAANQSENILVKPEMTGDVTKAEVSIPASTVSQIERETKASLTVATPIADVTIPRTALETLGSAGGSVNVAAEQVGQSVVMTLTAGGENVKSVPGGLTLSVPAEDAGPGTVAMLVHENGTREVIRKSVAEDGMVNIPLSGSATVEIVDNSKQFTDVPPESWAADAVAFASAHELFSGTDETTFSPDQTMSRGMLARVLYSLEGCPTSDQTSEFSDVDGDAWYANAITWATENGITSGYGEGQFGPDDSITREQFAVMLWKYAGSPQANEQVLAFQDADQISSYAQEALCWAVENDIVSGYADGLLAPGETTTRAQAALMLKNFMENT